MRMLPRLTLALFLLLAVGCDSDANNGNDDPVVELSIESSLGERANYVYAQGQTTSLRARTVTASGVENNSASVAWTSSDPAVATVTAQGQIRGVAPGETTITASMDGQSDAVTLRVFNLTGTWTSSSVEILAGMAAGVLTLELVQEGTSVSGTFAHTGWMTLGPNAGVGPVEGTVLWNRLAANATVAMGCAWALSGPLVLSFDGEELILSGDDTSLWDGTSSCGGGGNGRFFVTMPVMKRGAVL